jgi:hypothetical protein
MKNNNLFNHPFWFDSNKVCRKHQVEECGQCQFKVDKFLIKPTKGQEEYIKKYLKQNTEK